MCERSSTYLHHFLSQVPPQVALPDFPRKLAWKVGSRVLDCYFAQFDINCLGFNLGSGFDSDQIF